MSLGTHMQYNAVSSDLEWLPNLGFKVTDII